MKYRLVQSDSTPSSTCLGCYKKCEWVSVWKVCSGSIPLHTTMKITIKNNRSIKRQVSIELGVITPKTKIYKNKKKYTRKTKHKNYD